MGGQVGIADHITVGDKVSISAPGGGTLRSRARCDGVWHPGCAWPGRKAHAFV